MTKIIKYYSNDEIRLDKYLKIKIPDLSRTKIQKYIETGIIKVDDFSVKSSYKLKVNQIITIDDTHIVQEKLHLVPENIDLDIIYEDNHILVINKNPGIVVHPGIGNQKGTLLNGVLYYCSSLSEINNRPGVIHRLDKETSGVIVFAKTDKAHYFISEQFANRKVKKKYLAIVWGNIIKDLTVEGYLNRDNRNRLRYKLFKENGKFSTTYITPYLNYSVPISIVDVYPKTGRTHQIRVHMSSVGHSILKDKLYNGGDSVINSFHQKYKLKLERIVKSINRVALHAHEIQFSHPENGKKVSFSAPIPDDFKNILKILDEYK